MIKEEKKSATEASDETPRVWKMIAQVTALGIRKDLLAKFGHPGFSQTELTDIILDAIRNSHGIKPNEG